MEQVASGYTGTAGATCQAGEAHILIVGRGAKARPLTGRPPREHGYRSNDAALVPFAGARQAIPTKPPITMGRCQYLRMDSANRESYEHTVAEAFNTKHMGFLHEIN